MARLGSCSTTLASVGMGPSLPTQEVANCSAPKGHMAGFALTESKKETCPQLDQLSYIDNRGVKTDSQIG